FVSIGFFLFYYVCLIGGEELANRLIMPPWLAMGLANLGLGLRGLDLTARAGDLHLKLAFPLIGFIVVMLGAALSTRLRMQGAALGFGLSIAISFLYYGVMRAMQALGHNGALPPYVAAWAADVVFGTVGLVMLSQAQRR
ncbi:MAG: LptF/LptG family permease, partial [bacterium]